jgi:hypothetical protein
MARPRQENHPPPLRRAGPRSGKLLGYARACAIGCIAAGWVAGCKGPGRGAEEDSDARKEITQEELRDLRVRS